MRAKAFAWSVVGSTAIVMAWQFSEGVAFPPASSFLFWIGVLIAVEFLPVSLGFQTVATMAFPIDLAVEILYEPFVAMVIIGIGAFDLREIRREIPVWHALFNRAQLMLAAGAASAVLNPHRDDLFQFGSGTLAIVAATIVHYAVNLGLVTIWVNRLRGVSFAEARKLVPRPVLGFVAVQILLAGLGTATAAAYKEVGPFVAAFLIPLLFARLSILGARAQQELSERVRKQQEALLAATEKVFQERENERKRIAEDIHDSSLQMLAAATYGCGNAQDFFSAGRLEQARSALGSIKEAIEGAMTELRDSIMDLRKSSVEEGGLTETIRKFADQVSAVWGADVRIEGSIDKEPPLPVALAGVQILQEGLVNALKHGDNSAVVVRIADDDGMVHIVVEDDGPGFDLEQEVGADHVGMRLMKERAARVGGRIKLDSRHGSGTRLEAILPGGVTQ